MSKSEETKKTGAKSTKKNDSTKKTDNSKKTTKKVATKAVKKDVVKQEVTLEEADSVYHVSLLAQTVCVIGVLAISILAIFENSFTVPIEVLVGITLFIMAYNNAKMFNRKGLTIVYIIFGIVSFITGISGYFGMK